MPRFCTERLISWLQKYREGGILKRDFGNCCILCLYGWKKIVKKVLGEFGKS